VVYASVSETPELVAFTSMTHAIHAIFREAGLVNGNIAKEFNPHATLMKTWRTKKRKSKSATSAKTNSDDHEASNEKAMSEGNAEKLETKHAYVKRVPKDVYEEFSGMTFRIFCQRFYD
jgi:hypothetical protein